MFWIHLPDCDLYGPKYQMQVYCLFLHVYWVIVDSLRFRRACSPASASLLPGCPIESKCLMRNAMPGVHVDTVKNRWGLRKQLVTCLLATFCLHCLVASVISYDKNIHLSFSAFLRWGPQDQSSKHRPSALHPWKEPSGHAVCVQGNQKPTILWRLAL